MRKKKRSIKLINEVRTLIIKENLFQPKTILILTFSGGQDSICLLTVLYILKKQYNSYLKILSCNHLWQQDSLYSYFHVLQIAYSFEIEIFLFVNLKNTYSEEKSRYWRSKIFNRILELQKNAKILTGHTLTDQIETFFFNLTRGSGFKGNCSLQKKKNSINLQESFFLKSILNKKKYFFKIKKKSINKFPVDSFFLFKQKLILNKKTNLVFLKKKKLTFKKKIGISKVIIRPLIKQTRFDLKKISNIWKLPLFPDQSNQEKNFSRNRLRKQLLPSIRFFFNPQIDFLLYRYNEILFTEEKYFEDLIKKVFFLLINDNKNGYFINLQIFFSLSLSFQRRFCLFIFIEKLFIKINFSLINNFLVIIKKQYLQLKKDNQKNKKKIISIIFPKIGTIFLSANFIIFLK